MKLLFTLATLFSCSLSAQTWVQKTDCPGSGRFWATSFVCEDKIYTGTGRPEFSSLSPTSDMWQYDPATDAWAQVANFPGGNREGTTSFSYDNRGFMAFGSPFIQFTNDVWEYIPESNTWEQKASCPASFAFSHGFVIDDHFYIGPENGTNKTFAYDITNDSWSEVAAFPGDDRRAQVAFSVNGKGYLGMGADVFSGVESDFYRYDPVSDSWEEIASISPTSDQSSGFSIDNVGYVYNVGGSGGGGKSIYKYNETLDQWELVSTKPDDRIANASMIGYNGKAYLTFGERTTSGGNIPSSQIWEFTPGSTSLNAEPNAYLKVIQSTGNNIKVLFDAGQSTEYQVRIFAINGQLIHETSIERNNSEILFNVSSGVYLLQLIDDQNRMLSTKFIR
jgi:N-acetylneuraminic acid mutarotase